MNTSIVKLGVEELDARVLPSLIIPVDSATVVMAATSLFTSPSHPLQGSGNGLFVGSVFNIDGGTSDQLSGKITLSGFGSFSFSGWVQGTGMYSQGRATGELVLQNENGTMTLALHGPVQSKFSPIPRELVYSITSGSGAYQNANGYGIVNIGYLPAPTAFGLPPRGDITIAMY